MRKIAKEVPIIDIKKPKIQKLLKDMSLALHSQGDGVAIAAPQVAKSLRIFIVSGKIFDEEFVQSKESNKNNPPTKDCHPDLIFINPVLKKISKNKRLLEEGCLSVRPVFGSVYRATKATVEAYNECGKKFVRGGSGLLAHIFQHEIDHLEGILFTDKAKEAREVL